MRNKIGKILIAFGVVLVLGACGLFCYYQAEEKQAQLASQSVMEQMLQYLQPEETQPAPNPMDPEEPVTSQPGQGEEPPEEEPVYPDPYDPEMTVVELDGYGYVGYITIKDLGKMLPVMSEWDDKRLKTAPCRYMGGTKTDDFVICGHNYKAHLGGLATLKIGSEILFTDMDGEVTTYQVVEVTVLEPTAIEEMTSAEYPLTLFTCTYGGKSRVTVRCIKAN